MNPKAVWKRRLGAALVVALVPVGVASADAYADAAKAACERAKSCAMQQMGDVPADMRPMIEASLNSMCLGLPQAGDWEGFSPSHPLYRPATACMKSIAALSCDAFAEGDGETPECRALDKAAAAYQ